MAKLLDHEKVKPLLSDEHFSVDGTLIEAWASHKSFKPKRTKKGDDGSNFRGQVRKNDTHQSTTDPEAKLSQGRRARGQALLHGPCVDGEQERPYRAVSSRRRTAQPNDALRKPCSRTRLRAQSASLSGGQGV